MAWDRGLEITEHGQFTVDTGRQVHFGDPAELCSAARMRGQMRCCAIVGRTMRLNTARLTGSPARPSGASQPQASSSGCRGGDADAYCRLRQSGLLRSGEGLV